MNYSCQSVTSYVSKLGLAAGMNEREARTFARSLVSSNMRGLDSHGVMRTGAYLKRIEDGFLTPNAEPRVTKDAGTMLAVDGANGLGMYTAKEVMRMCVERAKETGICLTAVRNSNHFGNAAYFTRQASRQHMIGFAMANSPKAVAPFGGAEPMFGTNPLCIVIPTRDGLPYELDMATSLVAQGKLILARKEGRSVPEGWGVDRSGNRTADPGQILDGGTLLPFGGAKGYAITLMIELMCVALAQGEKSTTMGSMYRDARPQGTGFVLGAINVNDLVGAADFEAAAAEVLRDIKNSRRSPDCSEILMPGEIENNKFQKAISDGITISDTVIEELRSLGLKYGVPYSIETIF